MLRILVCCAGGFSSSALSVKVNKEIEEKQLADKVYIDFSPFSLSFEKMKDFDVIMCCPHQKYKIKEIVDKHIGNDIPVYLLPPRMYGTMELEEVMADAEDIIEGFKKNPVNPFHFEGETNVMTIKRAVAYRHAHKKG